MTNITSRPEQMTAHALAPIATTSTHPVSNHAPVDQLQHSPLAGRSTKPAALAVAAPVPTKNDGVANRVGGIVATLSLAGTSMSALVLGVTQQGPTWEEGGPEPSDAAYVQKSLMLGLSIGLGGLILSPVLGLAVRALVLRLTPAMKANNSETV